MLKFNFQKKTLDLQRIEKLLSLRIRDKDETYKTLEKIDEGGQGVIYLVEDMTDPKRKKYALKHQNIKRSLGNVESEISIKLLRMFREIYSNCLKHPHITEIRE